MNSYQAPPEGTPSSTRSTLGMQHSMPTNQETDDTVQITPSHLWGAFRRHWLLAVFLGAIAAVPVVYLAWKYVPAPYVAEAEIQVLMSAPHTLFEVEQSRNDFKTFKAKQLKEVRHERILQAVLGEPEIVKLPMVQEAKRKPTGDLVWLQESLQVKSPSDEFFTISLEGEDPDALAKIVKFVSERYVESANGEMKSARDAREVELITQRDRLEEEIKIAEDDLKGNNRSTPTQQDLERNAILTEIVDLKSEIRKAQSELRVKEARLAPVDIEGDESKNDGETFALKGVSEAELENNIDTDVRYISVEQKKQRIKRNLDRYIKAFNSEAHPQIIKLKKAYADVDIELQEKREELRDWYRNEFQKMQNIAGDQSQEELKFQIATLEQNLSRWAEELKVLEEASRELAEESKYTDVNEEELRDKKELASAIRSELYKIGLEKKIEGGREGDQSQGRVSIYRAATPPRARSMKKKYMLAGGGGFAAFGLMVAIVTLLELRFMKISSLKHLENEFHFPVLGTIPNLPARYMNGNEVSGKGEFYRHVFAESVDTTRTMIINLQKQQEFNTLMVTSSLGGEGKSTLSCHLAISFARGGRKTLLIDGDLRSPRVHEVFQLAVFPGLCEAIRDELPAEKCVVETSIPRLSLLPAGELDHTTLRMLAEGRVGEILGELREQYDMIIFDSAPVLPVTDTLLLLQSVDGVVLSIRKDVTRISKLASTLNKIEMLGGNLFGAVVTGIDEDDYGYRSKYIRNYHTGLQKDRENSKTAVTSG